MNKIKTYFEESWTELFTKVTWPTWPELQSSTIVVMVASLIIALMIFAMDMFFSGVLGTLYQMFS